MPAAFVSLVDADRDFYKSACGFGEPLASARALTGLTFCHYTVARTTPLVIPDTAADPVYRDVPTVRTLGVAAYVGVPLLVGGQAVGAFCAIDVRPRAWTDERRLSPPQPANSLVPSGFSPSNPCGIAKWLATWTRRAAASSCRVADLRSDARAARSPDARRPGRCHAPA
ncbi:GAF domain-containing protein [Roseisolibacter sp. H3M3-2]|uniref:GAF domain-containing protein n=1 Tax=Roseisolibacter sp. H3M3-2 TaxID=3031323 RepID=UPI0031F2FEFA